MRRLPWKDVWLVALGLLAAAVPALKEVRGDRVIVLSPITQLDLVTADGDAPNLAGQYAVAATVPSALQ